MINIAIERRHVYFAAIVVVIAAMLVPVGAWASHQFSDVSDSNQFHDDISWLKDSGVTLGCGGGKYCPDGFVTRQQMAAFMHRLGVNKVVDAKTNSGMSILAAGTIDGTGAIQSGTGNFTVTKTATGTYSIAISGMSYVLWDYVTSATASSAGAVASANSMSGKVLIFTSNAAGVKTDDPFTFIVYDPTP